MDTVLLSAPAATLDITSAKRIADEAARGHFDEPETFCLSWYDRARDREAPAHVSECREGTCAVPGYVEYATSRGASLEVVVGDQDFVFLYRALRDL